MVISPWVYRNKKEFNVAGITMRSGHLLLWRAMRTEYTAKEILMHVIYGASDTLGRKLFPEDYSRMTVRGKFGPDNVYLQGDKIYHDYLAQGYSSLEADQMLRQRAIDLIQKHPGPYALQSFVELWKLSFFEIVPFAYSDKYNEWMGESPAFYTIGKILRVGLRYFYSWIILILAAIGFLKTKKILESNKWVFVLPILYVVATALPLNVTPRYLYPALPFIMIFAAAVFSRSRNGETIR